MRWPWGSIYLLKGMQMLWCKGLRRFVILPLLVNTLLFAVLLYAGVHYFSHLTQWLATLIPRWLQWLSWLLWVLFSIAAIVILTYTFTLLANLIAAPFNGFLAEKVVQLITGHPTTVSADRFGLLRDTPHALKRALQFFGYYILRAVMVLLLFFIPLLQVVATPTWFLFNAWMMTVQYMDYPMDNHRITFAEMRTLLARKCWVNLSFGSAVMIATMLPIINFVVMPAAVIGATLLYLDEYQELSSTECT